MAPEQMRQEECGRRADVWAFGGCWLFAMTGDFPWRHASGFEQAHKLNAFAFFFKVLRRRRSSRDIRATGSPPPLLFIP